MIKDCGTTAIFLASVARYTIPFSILFHCFQTPLNFTNDIGGGLRVLRAAGQVKFAGLEKGKKSPGYKTVFGDV